MGRKAKDIMEEKVKKIIAEQLNVSEDAIKPDASLTDDLGADSLDMVELIMAFSDEFEIDIPDEAAENVSTVGDLIDYLKNNA